MTLALSTPPVGSAPKQLGGYRIVRPLGRGGMAEVFLAERRGPGGFSRLAVLKRVRPEHAATQGFRDMFLDEARLAALLHHPNICQAFEFGIEDGDYFLAMEYVHGENLRKVMGAVRRSGSIMPLPHALHVISSIAAGLHHAHEQTDLEQGPLGIVHRDVNPSNVMLSYDGSVKLLDFGIAKATQRQTETLAGELKGKIAYMAPEQCRGKDVDRRVDVFALGIVLWELTCGARLFAGATEVATLNKIVNEPIEPPSSRCANYPPELEAIAMKALARRPEDRFATAKDLQLALEGFAAKHRIWYSSSRLSGYLHGLLGDRVHRRPEDGGLVDATTDTTAHGTRPDDVRVVVLEPEQFTEIAQPAARPAGSASMASASGARAAGDAATAVAGTAFAPDLATGAGIRRGSVAIGPAGSGPSEMLPSRRRRRIAAIAAAVGALAGVVLVRSGWPLGEAAPNPAPRSESSALARPAEVVSIAFDVVPADAEVELDGHLLDRPSVDLPRSSREFRLVTRASGYMTDERRISAARSSVVRINLQPDAAEPSSAPAEPPPSAPAVAQQTDVAPSTNRRARADSKARQRDLARARKRAARGNRANRSRAEQTAGRSPASKDAGRKRTDKASPIDQLVDREW